MAQESGFTFKHKRRRLVKYIAVRWCVQVQGFGWRCSEAALVMSCHCRSVAQGLCGAAPEDLPR
jgi:hypothetical protein